MSATREDESSLNLDPAPDIGRLQDHIGRALRDAIIDGRLVPGKLYSVQQLADRFGVSRSPVREALLDLAQQGMVRFERNRGVRVLETSAHDLEEILELRLLLEVPATFRATTQMTPEVAGDLRSALQAMRDAAKAGDERTMMRHDVTFHHILLTMSGNLRLAHSIERLRDLVLTKGASTAGHSRTLADIVAEHEEIANHAIGGRAPEAAAAMKHHLLSTGRLLLRQEGQSPDGALAWAQLVSF